MKEQNAAHSSHKTLDELISEFKSLPYGVSLEKFIFDYFAIHINHKQRAELSRLRSELQQKDEEINLREAQQDVMAADTVKLLDQIEFQNKTVKEDYDKIKKLEFELQYERKKVERAFIAGRSKISWKQFQKDEKAKLNN